MNATTYSRTEAGPAFSLNLLWPLRVFMGLTFLYAGLQHLTDPSYFDPTKAGYIGNLIQQYAAGSPIHDFLIGVVKPNAVLFGYTVGVGEMMIGVATLLGFLFRIAALAGLFLNTTFLLSATWNVFPFYFGSDIVFAICWLTLLLTGPQLSQSIDGVLAARFPSLRWLTQKVDLTATKSHPSTVTVPNTKRSETRAPLPERTHLYPKQVQEVDRAFDRIKEQFLADSETQTILEFARAFVISLGVDRSDARKILGALQNIVNRDAAQAMVAK